MECILNCYIVSGFTRKNKVPFIGLVNLNETENLSWKTIFIAGFLKGDVE